MRKLIPTLPLLLWLLWGCVAPVPEAGGPYENRRFLLASDMAFDNSIQVLNAFMTWEYQNHAFLYTNAPAVVLAEETIRTNTPLWVSVYGIARSNYVAMPSVTTSNALASQVEAIKAQAALAKAVKR